MGEGGRTSEQERIELLSSIFGGGEGAHVRLGIGDDAAVLDAPRGEALVWTVDAVVEGVHFPREGCAFEDVGWRSFMAAASDLAAMGARPLGALSSLVLSDAIDDTALSALARGQRAAADALGTSIVGGNLARGGELSITTTLLGAARRPIGRRGARPGDAIWLAGPVGLAAAGLSLVLRGVSGASAAERSAIDAFLRPRARIEAGLAASSYANAGIDVSDGLALDLARLALASRVRIALAAHALVTDELRDVAAVIGADAVDLALNGGDDYAIAIAASPRAPLEGTFLRIGDCEPEIAGEPPIAMVSADGTRTAVTPRGFDHFERVGAGLVRRPGSR